MKAYSWQENSNRAREARQALPCTAQGSQPAKPLKTRKRFGVEVSRHHIFSNRVSVHCYWYETERARNDAMIGLAKPSFLSPPASVRPVSR